ncbi:MHYT domain-containing protein [Actinomadura fibrosa]|uniref:MHYT domain-containing protein n=1 Tax=Actinomadura fibrosa TaxID=111802 RepID=A0ABW2XRX2_9ACTN|nr:MHYT domain-containing protein [Actinomadura fibrosa]
MHHFTYGAFTPVLAYLMSFVGSLLGLKCTARAARAEGVVRGAWLVTAAVSIGGTGIWVMHFIAMLGFSVSGMHIRYHVGLTLLSAALAIGIVGGGLLLVGFGGGRARTLLLGGVVTGVGVAGMHYTGMASMDMEGEISYQYGFVLLSVLIAVAAATAALWFATRVRGMQAMVGAALIMGVAVTGMHYTGMAAMRVRTPDGLHTPSGAEGIDFLLPLIVAVSIVSFAVLLIVSVNPEQDDLVFAHRDGPGRTAGERAPRPQGPPPGTAPGTARRQAGQWFGGEPPR